MRKAPSAKRRKTSGPKRPVATAKRRSPANGNVQKSIMKMRHPFHAGTHQPKIPDDSVAHSLSRVMQNVSEIQNAAGQNVMHVLIHPSLGIGCSVIGDINAYAGRNVTPLGFPNQQLHFDGTEIWSASAGDEVAITNGSDIVKKRLISQGFRCALNNVEEERDGWFEVCRIHDTKAFVTEFRLGSIDGGGTNYTEMGLMATAGGSLTMDAKLAGLEMTQLPGYETGLLKDIHKREFKLNPISHTMPWSDLYPRYQMTPPDDLNWDHTDEQIEFNLNNAKGKDFYEAAMDLNHDFVYIRIHPRTNTGSGNANGSKLITHLIQSWEFCLGADSEFASFQTPAPGVAGISKVIGGLNDNPQATKSRNG